MKKNASITGVFLSIILVMTTTNGFAEDTKNAKKSILSNKTTNPNYDPNKGIMGKSKEDKVIKRTRNEPIIKNRKYEPIIKKK